MLNANGSTRPNQPVDERLEPLDEIAPHVEKRHPGGPEQILQRAGHQEVHAQRMHVERRRAGPLVVVQQDVCAALATECRQSCDVEPVAVAEADMRRRHDERPLVDLRVIRFDGQGVVMRPGPCDARTAPLLGEPHMPHGRELELAEHHRTPVGVERKRGRDRGDARRRVRHHGDFVGIGANRGGEGGAQPLDFTDPAVPRRPVRLP